MATKIADQIKNILSPFATEVGKDIKTLTDTKQDKLKPGLNITITPDGTISATGAGEAPDLSNYPTTTQVGNIVDGKLADYVKTDALANYVQTSALNSTLADYVKTEALAAYVQTETLTSTLEPYAKTAALDAYVKTDALTNTLEPYAKTEEVVKTTDLDGLEEFNLVNVYKSAKNANPA